MKNEFPNSNTLDDNLLWSQLRKGDEKAFSMLFQKFYPDLIRYGTSFLSQDEKVKDCVQDLFAEIWLYKEKLNDSVVVKAYLLSSLRKRMARQHERERIFKKTKTTDSLVFLKEFSIEQQFIEDEITLEKIKRLNTLLNRLPARQRESLYLRFHQGMRIDEIAGIMQINYQSATNLIHRALLHLRKEWKEDFTILFFWLSINSNGYH